MCNYLQRKQLTVNANVKYLYFLKLRYTNPLNYCFNYFFLLLPLVKYVIYALAPYLCKKFQLNIFAIHFFWFTLLCSCISEEFD